MENLEIIAKQMGFGIMKCPAEYGVPKGYCLFHLDSGESIDFYDSFSVNLKELAEVISTIMKYHYTQTKEYV